MIRSLFGPRALYTFEGRTKRPLGFGKLYLLPGGGSVQPLRVHYPSATDPLARILLRFARTKIPFYTWRPCLISGQSCYVELPELGWR